MIVVCQLLVGALPLETSKISAKDVYPPSFEVPLDIPKSESESGLVTCIVGMLYR